jgi:hypothetical protein
MQDELRLNRYPFQITENEFRWNCFTRHPFTPHAPSRTVAHSEGRSSTNVTNLNLYTNPRFSLENVHTAPSIHKKVGAAFAETKSLVHRRSMVAKIRGKTKSKENPESIETKKYKK